MISDKTLKVNIFKDVDEKAKVLQSMTVSNSNESDNIKKEMEELQDFNQPFSMLRMLTLHDTLKIKEHKNVVKDKLLNKVEPKVQPKEKALKVKMLFSNE